MEEKKITITKEEFKNKVGDVMTSVTVDAAKQNGMQGLVVMLVGAKIFDKMINSLFGEENSKTETEPDTETKTEETNEDNTLTN